MKLKTILITAAFLAGCSSAPPTMQTGPEAETSYDGLVRIDNSRFKGAWGDPDIDMSRYNKVMAGGAVYEFRAVKDTGNMTTRQRSNQSEFFIDDKDRARLEEETSKIFAEELAKSTRFTMTEEKGPDVLILRGALHDIVSNVPPDYIGRSEIYISSVGEATLVIEGVDSLSGEVVVRIIERRAAQRPGGSAIMANTVTTWAEVRRMVRNWANTLVEGLDSIPAE
jgi:hypothetical protein